MADVSASIIDGYEMEATQLDAEIYTVSFEGSASVTTYLLRAQDSGLVSPGYVTWTSTSADFSDAPTPTGTYSDLTILKKTVS